LQELKNYKDKDKDKFIFNPIVIGVIISAVWGIVQSITSWGLSPSSLGYRQEYFGYGAEGFQPDLHAFAGHMAVGCVGLLGYLYLNIKRDWIILFAILVSWIALVLSKSRATLIFVFISYFIFFILYLRENKLSIKTKIIYFLLLIFGLISFLIVTKNYLWIYTVFSTLFTADLSDLNVLDKLTRQRFELHGAAIKMWFQFPIFGIGQGNFFRLSSIFEFSGSHYMSFVKGENAHNYFLQTFAELGFVGMGCYLIVFLKPFLDVSDIKKLFPAFIGTISIFLGNIFSHSLIIRENIFLLAAFVALLYGWSESEKGFMSNRYCRGSVFINKSIYFILFLILITLLLILNEINNSFTLTPFEYGRLAK
jgi:O-antigen ligase